MSRRRMDGQSKTQNLNQFYFTLLGDLNALIYSSDPIVESDLIRFLNSWTFSNRITKWYTYNNTIKSIKQRDTQSEQS